MKRGLHARSLVKQELAAGDLHARVAASPTSTASSYVPTTVPREPKAGEPLPLMAATRSPMSNTPPARAAAMPPFSARAGAQELWVGASCVRAWQALRRRP